MRFLADENFPGDAVRALGAAGHDVVWVRLEAPGSSDRDVLSRALTEARVLLTFDKDFGELAWRSRLRADCGVVLFRLPMPLPDEADRVIVGVLESRDDWRGHFSVVEPGRIRMRPL
jgi:predicted nuclease of predicted toxin-antitoxin system